MNFLQGRAGLYPRAVSFVRPHAQRFEAVDTARGLCLVWMILAHVLSTSGTDTASWLGLLLLPGWATTNFVMLSGLSIALVYARKPNGYWRKRALQLLVIAYLSNAGFGALRAVWNGQSGLESLVSLLTLQSPWTVSSILLPSSALLFLGSALEWSVERVGAPTFFVLVSVGELALWRTIQALGQVGSQTAVFASLFEFDNPWFGFPLGLLLALGIWAYSFGAIFRRLPQPPLWLLLGALIAASMLSPAVIGEIGTPFLYLFRFVSTLWMALALSWLTPLQPGQQLLALLGRSSLLIFLVHRLVLQCERVVLERLGFFHHPPTELAGAFMFLSTIAFCALLCVWRENNDAIGMRFKRIGM